MLDISLWTTRRLLPLAAIFAVVTALATPSIAIPGSARALGAAEDKARWTSQPPLRTARAGHEVVTVDRKILAIGGFTQRDLFDSVEARGLTGPGTWRYLTPMPTARANHAVAVLNGLVYAAGGFDETTVSNVVEVFNPRLGRWVNGPPLPERRAGASAAALGGLLYVAGGGVLQPDGTFSSVDSMIVYDPATRIWRSAAPMSGVRDRHRLVAAGRYLYAIGGLDRLDQTVTTLERYDPMTDSWRIMNPMHQSRGLPWSNSQDLWMKIF